jgi:hypothetical protein
VIGPLSVRLMFGVWWDRAGRAQLDGFIVGVIVTSALHAWIGGGW